MPRRTKDWFLDRDIDALDNDGLALRLKRRLMEGAVRLLEGDKLTASSLNHAHGLAADLGVVESLTDEVKPATSPTREDEHHAALVAAMLAGEPDEYRTDADDELAGDDGPVYADAVNELQERRERNASA